jgi:hypothetical protein
MEGAFSNKLSRRPFTLDRIMELSRRIITLTGGPDPALLPFIPTLVHDMRSMLRTEEASNLLNTV